MRGDCSFDMGGMELLTFILLLIKQIHWIWVSEWVSEWVSDWLLFNANSAIFQLYHGENKLIFYEMMMRSTLF